VLVVNSFYYFLLTIITILLGQNGLSEDKKGTHLEQNANMRKKPKKTKLQDLSRLIGECIYCKEKILSNRFLCCFNKNLTTYNL
jgi:hypothetical protein